jgi:hypothetical protein
MSVSAIGLNYENEDGMQASLAATFRAHRENGNVLLNLNDARDARAEGRKDGPKMQAPRPEYKHQPYPTFRHHPDGRSVVANTPAEADALEGRGFRAAPYPVVRVAFGDPGAEKARLQAKLAESDGKLATQNELLLQLHERLAALETAGKSTPEARKR